MEIPFIIAAVAIAGLLIGVHLLEKRASASRELTELEVLFLLARLTETSEYEQFRRAASAWNISAQQVENDFSRYLFQSRLPHYLRDYLRKARDTVPELQGRGGDFFSGLLIPRRKNDALR